MTGRLATTVVATVWLHQGLWCKVLGKDPSHRDIVARAPAVGPNRARAVTVAIGLGETALAAWVLSGRRPAAAAATQTGLLAAMNAGGLLVARELIPGAPRMLLRNLAFVTAIWTAAGAGRRP